MPLFADAVLDAALAHIATNGDVLIVGSGAEPTTYAGATGGAALGSVVPTYGAAADGSPSGRKRTVTPGAGTYSASGTAAWVAITDGTSALLAVVALAATKAVNSGDAINVSAFDLTFTDPTAV